MKMAALGIVNKSDFLVDIFGDNTSRGLDNVMFGLG